MTQRVAFLECTGDLWLEIATAMQRDCAWEPVYWGAHVSMQEMVETRFPGVAFHENTSAVKGQLSGRLAQLPLPPLDEELLAALSYAQTIALHMMDRMDPDGSFSFGERVRLYHRHLQIGLAVLNELSPDIIVCASPPHLCYDYALYRLARLKQTQVVIFVETGVDGLVFTTEEFEQSSQALRAPYRRLLSEHTAVDLSPAGERYLAKFDGDYAGAVPRYVAEIYADKQTGSRRQTVAEQTVIDELADLAGRLAPLGTTFRRSGPTTSKRSTSPAGASAIKGWVDRLTHAEERQARELAAAFARLQSMLTATGRGNVDALRDALDCTLHLYSAIETEYPLLFRSTDPAPITYFKQQAIPAEMSHLSYIEYWLYRSLALNKKRELCQEYDSVTQTVDLSEPFVYMPLHYQPESSTSPEAGVFVEQRLMVELLSKTVPPGWFVYVKEHPFQFDKRGSGEQSRPLGFYRMLAELPNVRLVAVDTPPFALIDNAKAVATATGTSGWEAILRGTPTLALGRAWYRECEGVFAAADERSLRQALADIAAGYRPDRRKVRFFLRALEDIAFRGYTISDLAGDAGVPAEQNASGFIAALKRCVGT